jgi:uncharacterized membrane protein YgcG
MVQNERWVLMGVLAFLARGQRREEKHLVHWRGLNETAFQPSLYVQTRSWEALLHNFSQVQANFSVARANKHPVQAHLCKLQVDHCQLQVQVKFLELDRNCGGGDDDGGGGDGGGGSDGGGGDEAMELEKVTMHCHLHH